jgi:hypothetical protein
MPKQIFAPITKVDTVNRIVYGVAALEEVDKSKEIMDYEGSKKYFEKWSLNIKKASGGKSVGNVREMHKPIAAGKLNEITFDDDNKRIEVASKVVDDSTWAKVEEGVLTGYSIGGEYVKKWKDTIHKGVKRYIVDPNEISLVDNPCMYGATFDVVKADGSHVTKTFVGGEAIKQYWSCSTEDCDAFHLTKEEAVSCDTVSKSAPDDEEDEEIPGTGEDEEVKKSLYDVSSLASTLSSAKWIVPTSDKAKAKFAKGMKALAEALVLLTKDEAEAITNDLATNGVTKGEGSMSEDAKKEEVVKFDEEALTQRVVKAVGASIADVIKASVKEAIDEAMEPVNEQIEVIGGAVEKMAGLPKPSKAVVKSADRAKAADGDDEGDEEEEEKPKKVVKTANVDDLVGEMREALSNPISIRKLHGAD